MKRIFPIFCIALLVCSLFAVTAFASELQPFAQTNLNNGQITFASVPEYQPRLYCLLNLDGENNPSFSGWVDIPTTYPDFNSYELPNIPYVLSIAFDESTNDLGITIEDSGGSYYDGTGTIYFYLNDPNAPAPTPAGTPLEEITEVFSNAGTWIGSALASFVAIFWTGSQLTFLGMLAVVALALAVILLVVLLINRWLRLQ